MTSDDDIHDMLDYVADRVAAAHDVLGPLLWVAGIMIVVALVVLGLQGLELLVEWLEGLGASQVTD